MTPSTAHSPERVPRDDISVADRASTLLRLAAAPTFAIMMVLTILDGRTSEMLASMGSHMSLPTGMMPMYLLMSVFHSPPWLSRIFLRRARANAARTTHNPSS